MFRFNIGYCRSGKVVSSEPHLDELVTDEDAFDAMAMFESLALAEFKRCAESDLFDYFQSHANNLRAVLQNRNVLEICMEEIGARNSLDIRRYAQKLLRPEFRDLRR